MSNQASEVLPEQGGFNEKLYQIPKGSKLVLPISDGENHDAVFHHIDGAYSYITLEDGTVVHLGASTEMVRVGDHYEIAEEDTHGTK